MKLLARVFGLSLLGLAFASTALADGITLSANYPSGYLWYSFTATNGTTYDVPVAPYSASVTNGGDTVSAYIICLDINNPTDVGEFYTGTFYTAETISDIPGQASLTINEEVSWMADQMAGINPDNPANTNITGPISLAIWQLEFGTSTNSEGGIDPIDPAAAAWITDAENAVASGYVPDSLFFIPNDTSSQRFVAISETPQPGTLGLLSTPEPGTIVLMGSGLLGLVGILRRRLSR